MGTCFLRFSQQAGYKEHGIAISIVAPPAFRCPHHDKHFVQEALRMVVDMKSEYTSELIACVQIVIEDMWAELHGTSPEVTGVSYIRHQVNV